MGINFRDPFPTRQLASPRYNDLIKQLENNFKKPPVRPPGEPPFSLLKFPKIPGGGVVGGAAAAVVLDLLFPEPTADEDLILLHKHRGGAPPSNLIMYPGEPPQEIQPGTYPFTGGQSYGVLYNVLLEQYYPGISPSQYQQQIYGRILGIEHTIGVNYDYGADYSYRHYFQLASENSSGAKGYTHELIANYGSSDIAAGYPPPYVRIMSCTRADGKPDTGGNPPSTQAPIISQPGRTDHNPDQDKREVGDSPTPPPLPQAPQQPLSPQTPKFPDPMPDRIPFVSPNEPNKPENPPQDNDDTAPKVGDPPPQLQKPTILYGPSSDPGSIKIIQPFSPAPLPPGQTFTPELTPDRSPQPKPQTPEKPKVEPPPEKPDIEKFRDKLNDVINNPGFGLVTVGTILRGITNNTNPEVIKNAAKAGTCESFNPGGCNADIRQNAANAANNSANNASLLERLLNSLSSLASLELLPKIDAKLGEQIPNGGIGGKLSRFINWSIGDRVMGMVSMVASVHNAMMLSNNVGQTLFSILDNLGNIGSLIVKPDGDTNIDSKTWLTSNLDSLFSTMLGAEVWKSVKASYRAANNIFSTSSNMYDNLRSIHNDSQELLNMVRRDTAELGNALVEEGVISEDNWDIRDPKVKIKSKSLIRLQRMNEGLEALDNKLEAIEQMTSTLLSIAQTAKEVKENVDQLGKQLGDANTAFKDTRDKAIEALPDFDFDIDDLF